MEVADNPLGKKPVGQQRRVPSERSVPQAELHGGSRPTGQETALAFVADRSQQRIPIPADRTEVTRPYAGGAQAVLDGMQRESARRFLDSYEALLLAHRDDLAVAEQRGGRVMPD